MTTLIAKILNSRVPRLDLFKVQLPLFSSGEFDYKTHSSFAEFTECDDEDYHAQSIIPDVDKDDA